MKDYDKKIYCRGCLVSDKQLVKVRFVVDRDCGRGATCPNCGFLGYMLDKHTTSWNYASEFLMKIEDHIKTLRDQLVMEM